MRPYRFSITDIDDAPLPPINPRHMGHFIAIQVAMRDDEAQTAREVAAELTPFELREWLADLAALSIPQAVARLRMQFAGLLKSERWRTETPSPATSDVDAISSAFEAARSTIKEIEHARDCWSPAQAADYRRASC